MKRGLVDLSSVVWTQLLGGKDKEFGRTVLSDLGKEVFVNSAAYGYEGAVDSIIADMARAGLVPSDLIFVMEGKNSKQDRQLIHPGYKFGRDKVEAQYEEFNKCKEMVLNAFLNVGAQMCWQDGGVEGDDVLGYLAANLEGERWIISGDKDLAQSVGDGVKLLRQGKINENPFGDFPHKMIPICIALVGDSGDKIPGARGFGPTAFQNMLWAFGNDGLELMEGLIKDKSLLKLEEDVPALRELQKIIDDADNVYMSYELGRLRTERVNTLRNPLQWRVGMVKQRGAETDERLRKWAGVIKLVAAEQYEAAFPWIKKQIELSPFVTLDVETTTPEASDEWLASRDKEDKVDVFGSTLTSLQLTFGSNLQYTVYMPIDNLEEPGITNLTIAQVRDVVDLIPRDKITYVHNAAFELPICFMAWGEDWKDDPEYYGFLRNVRDTAIGSSYTDENRPSRGLKALSKSLLGYEQVSFDQVTTRELRVSDWDGKGRELNRWHVQIPVHTGKFGRVLRGTGRFEMVDAVNHCDEPIQVPGKEIMEEVEDEIIEYVDGDLMVRVQHKTDQLTANDMISYGADDTICTAALANHFRVIMEIEKTWHVYEEVETFPAYLTAHAYVKGVAFSLESMAAQEKDDDAAYEKAWGTLREYLIKIGFDGTVFEPLVELKPADIKRAYLEIVGQELKTMIRTTSKLVKFIQLQAEDLEDREQTRALILAKLVEDNDLAAINGLMKEQFKGEPKLELGSTKQMKDLLYGFMGIPVKVINDTTENERIKQPELENAVRKFKKIRAGKSDLSMTPEEMVLMRQKAKVDDTAIDFALAFDADCLNDEARAALKSIGVMKKVMTRRSLFYKNYWTGLHWKDGKMHANTNQCAAVTRRYSMSDQNLTQLPKKGEGVRFRGHFKPHHRDAVNYTEDFASQELRLSAEASQDKNMLSCFVGEKLKDIHNITSAGAMKLQWGRDAVNALFAEFGSDLKDDEEGNYELFGRLRALGKSHPQGKEADDLRKGAKNVNFGALNGAKAVKLSETLVMPLVDAQKFLDARSAMFPDVDVAAARIADESKRLGYATTFMGARRHLRDAIMSNESGMADRAARQAFNYRIQGSAGEMTKLALKRIWQSGVLFRFDAQFIAPVHDEIFMSIHKDHAVEVIKIVHEAMTQPYSTMKVPVVGAIAVGPNLADQIECGEVFNAEVIQRAINDCFKEKVCA